VVDGPSSRVVLFRSGEFVRLQVESVLGYHLLRLDPIDLPDEPEAVIDLFVGQQYERHLPVDPVQQAEGRWSDVHLAVPDEDVAVAPEPAEALVLVDVVVACVQEVPMANHKVKHWVCLFLAFRVAPKHVVDGTTVVEPSADLAVAVEVGPATRKLQPL